MLSDADTLVHQPEPHVQRLCQMLLDRSELSRAGHRPGLCQEADAMSGSAMCQSLKIVF